MTFQDHRFEDAIERIETARSIDDLQHVLEGLFASYGLNQVAYHLIATPQIDLCREDDSICTIPLEFRQYFMLRRYDALCPIVSTAKVSLSGFDWAGIERSTPILRRIWEEAQDAGLGRNGITVPIRGAGGDRAIFSVTSNLRERDWALLRRRYLRDMQMIGLMAHERFLALKGVEIVPGSREITSRERECLEWAAAGKTIEDTATILTLSERSVRGYLDSARQKLDCMTKTHTVARAIQLGIVSI